MRVSTEGTRKSVSEKRLAKAQTIFPQVRELTGVGIMSSYNELELKVIRWAEARRIIPNGTPMAQAAKTIEEVGELVAAINAGDNEAMRDAYGDIFVTLIIGSDLANISLLEALEVAYEEIKDRKGTLTPEGIFVKEAV